MNPLQKTNNKNKSINTKNIKEISNSFVRTIITDIINQIYENRYFSEIFFNYSPTSKIINFIKDPNVQFEDYQIHY